MILKKKTFTGLNWMKWKWDTIDTFCNIWENEDKIYKNKLR